MNNRAVSIALKVLFAASLSAAIGRILKRCSPNTCLSRSVLDDGLPNLCRPKIFDNKHQAIYEHIHSSFGNESELDRPRFRCHLSANKEAARVNSIRQGHPLDHAHVVGPTSARAVIWSPLVHDPSGDP